MSRRNRQPHKRVRRTVRQLHRQFVVEAHELHRAYRLGRILVFLAGHSVFPADRPNRVARRGNVTHPRGAR